MSYKGIAKDDANGHRFVLGLENFKRPLHVLGNLTLTWQPHDLLLIPLLGEPPIQGAEMCSPLLSNLLGVAWDKSKHHAGRRPSCATHAKLALPKCQHAGT